MQSLIEKTKINALVSTILIIVAGVTSNAQKSLEKHQTFQPGELWEDTDGEHINAHGGGFMYQDGIYYWYGEHKGRNNSAQVGVRVYSSKDLYNWKNEGVALAVSEDPDSEITRGSVIERPKVVYNKKTGKYVMWFHLELKGQGYGAAKTAVAVSDSPLGPFKFINSFRPNAGHWPLNFREEWKKIPKGGNPEKWWTEEWFKAVNEGLYVRRDFEKGQMARDMTIYVDDDGIAYHIASSEENQTLHVSKLTEDYLSFTGKWVRMQPGGQNEAPAIFKHEDSYYMITSGLTGWDPNAARSFKAKAVMGPWESLGNPAIGKDSLLTFHSQSTFVLPMQGEKNGFIFMADRWRPKKPIDGRYIWLPVEMENEMPVLRWKEEWDLSVFEK